MLAVAILAAGESRRMGKPKALLPFHGLTFVEHLVEVTRHARIGAMRIVLGAHAEDIRARLGVAADSLVINENWEQGQLSSIQCAIRSLPPDATEGLLLCPVDHPLVSANLIAQLIKEFDSTGKAIVLPTHNGKRGHPVIFRATLYGDLLAASPEVGAREVVWSHSSGVAEVSTDEEGVVLNLNDPETLKKALGD
ncbi:MAG TPA: nucleotidyltransferase family protein [Candidatus Binataceae bacterium]|nr:nucleotidyltransferase family protein [Candidatus Binataceae bacterium]